MIDKKFVRAFKSVLQKHTVFEVIGHMRPDLDCWSGAVAMTFFLKTFNKKVILKCSPPSGYNLKYKPKLSPTKSPPEVCISVDCASKERLERPVEAKILINIDHHKSNAHFGDLNLVVSEMSSTCELLYWLFKEVERSEIWRSSRLDYFICLGILSDTNVLQTYSVSSSTFLALSELSKKVSVFDIVYDLNKKHNFDAFKKILSVGVRVNNGIVFFLSEKSDFKWLNDFVKFFTDFLWVISATLSSPKEWRCSVRSVDKRIDLDQICGKLGGGGHKGAAAFIYKGSKPALIKEIRQHFP